MRYINTFVASFVSVSVISFLVVFPLVQFPWPLIPVAACMSYVVLAFRADQARIAWYQAQDREVLRSEDTQSLP